MITNTNSIFYETIVLSFCPPLYIHSKEKILPCVAQGLTLNEPTMQAQALKILVLNEINSNTYQTEHV